MKLTYFKSLLAAASLASDFACTSFSQEEAPVQQMNDLAEAYVKTLLKLGQYDSDMVDAYYSILTGSGA
ncbi:hypothetical protein [Pontibacter actiniarum]|uniref:RagB/SusD family nutrient uptake outer membrane protein n=1 Tax=Pontibacter actiniarum TaxID=323450 RepID=A0A1X9YT50_9BACT|nr:hypothetical protein [Pontibacter actiniarum]ARS36032.1 hypothetical protein CA264_11630 [Pontibacter actiniarum]